MFLELWLLDIMTQEGHFPFPSTTLVVRLLSSLRLYDLTVCKINRGSRPRKNHLL